MVVVVRRVNVSKDYWKFRPCSFDRKTQRDEYTPNGLDVKVVVDMGYRQLKSLSLRFNHDTEEVQTFAFAAIVRYKVRSFL